MPQSAAPKISILQMRLKIPFLLKLVFGRRADCWGRFLLTESKQGWRMSIIAVRRQRASKDDVHDEIKLAVLGLMDWHVQRWSVDL